MKILKYVTLTLACVFLILSFACSIIMPVTLIPQYTVHTADDDYYCETTYYSTERAFREQNKAYNAAGEFVGATVKKLYVCETSDEKGNVTKSYPLKKEQIEEVGEDNESIYNLSIQLIVTFDNELGLYRVFTASEWKSADKSDFGREKPERKTMDYINLSWGGAGALAAIDVQTYGEYENGAEIHIIKSKSDSLAGFVWQFGEKVKHNPMRFVQTSMCLKNLYEYQGKETYVKMAYIHTFSKVTGSLSLINSIGYLSPRIIFKEYDDWWQIEIDVHGITY